MKEGKNRLRNDFLQLNTTFLGFYTLFYLLYIDLHKHCASVRGKADAAEHQECYMLACSLFLLFE